MDLPHVTEILRRVGFIDSRWFTEEARRRGTAVHIATHYLDLGDLHWPSVPEAARPRVEQYQRFLEEKKPRILAIEEPVKNLLIGYQGRLDRRLELDGHEGVLDIKPPGPQPWHGIQTALYAGCFNRRLKRWSLHLSDTSWKLEPHLDRNDWEVGKAAAMVVAWANRFNPNGGQ